MNFNFIKNKTSDNKKLRNKGAWKQGGFAVAITSIVIAVAVAVNVVFAVLAQRINLEIDISLSGSNSLSQENIDYIKGLTDKVTITVCFTEEDFVSGTEYIAQQQNASDTTGSSNGKYAYYEQTLNLLKLYDVYSENVDLVFVDPYDPSFSEYTKYYTGISHGDILVECEKVFGGEKYTRNEILEFEDIYYLTEDDSYAAFGYTSYIVSGNNIETALTSAIYKVTSNETQKVLVLEHHCEKGKIAEYIAYLEQNNFSVDIFSEGVINSIDKDVDMLIISEPTEDFASDELDIIDEWLYNGGLRGKGIMYLASPSSPEMPNLYAYLEEWGIAFDEGLLYETNANYQVFSDPTTLFFVPSEIDTSYDETANFEKLMNGGEAIAGGCVPILQVYKESGLRLTTPIAETPEDSVVIAPLKDFSTDWKPDGTYEQNKQIGIIMATETDYIDNEVCTSYVAVFASRDFVDPYWFSTGYDINSDIIINTAKTISGASDDGITFSMRQMKDNSFTDVVTREMANTIRAIFQWAVPVILVIAGVVVFARRARR